MSHVLYAETSAVLRWVLGAPGGEVIRDHLDQAEAVVASRLTLVEARRALTRAGALGEISPPDLESARALLVRAASRWILAEMFMDILDRAAEPFPAEAVRTLDAIHLATALYLHTELVPLVMLSTDDRVARNARLLGIRTLP